MYGFDWKEAVESAPKYKVGQRVRVIDADGGGKVGDVAIITNFHEDDDFGFYYQADVLSNGCHGLYEHRFEPAFLPGDKVRVTRCNGYFAAGDEGVVEKQGKYNVFVKHGLYQRVGLPIEPEKLELVEAAGDDQPKFKAGDVVITKGGEGDVGEGVVLKYNGDGTYQVKFSTWYGECREPEGWLTLVTAAPCPQDNEQHETTLGDILEAALTKRGIVHQRGSEDPCIVALVKNGQPRPSTYPHVHASAADATKEAERLARNNPGQEFAVYQRVAGRKAEVHVEMKEVA